MGGLEPCGFDTDRTLVDRLLDVSDIAVVPLSIGIRDSIGLISGWTDASPVTKNKPPNQLKKKRNPTREERLKIKRPSQINSKPPVFEAPAYKGDNSPPSEPPKPTDAFGLTPSVRCVDDDFLTSGNLAQWKANVEPVTYRYVPNNGFYRKHKYPKSKDVNTPRASTHLSLQKRLLRKEIQRELKRGLDPLNSLTRASTEKFLATPTGTSEGGLNRERSKSDTMLKYSSTLSTVNTPQIPSSYLDQGAISRSVNEKYIDSFHSRISALDEEMKQDAKLYVPSRQEEDNRSPFRKSRMKDLQIGPMNVETLNQEIFCIKPLRNKQPNLRPLEKITPHQRITEDLAKMTMAQLKYTTASNSDTLNLPKDDVLMNKRNLELLEDVRYRYSDGEDFNGTRGPDTGGLQSAFTTTKVIPNNKYSFKKLVKPVVQHTDSTAVLNSKGYSPVIEKEYNAESVQGSDFLDGQFSCGISGKQLGVPLLTNH